MLKSFFSRLFSVKKKESELADIEYADRLIRNALNSGKTVNLKFNLSRSDWEILAERFPSLKNHIKNELQRIFGKETLPGLPNFIAIDFETANNERTSACSLGIVVYKEGVIVDRIHYLINPGEISWSSINMGIHSIRPEHVLTAPKFNEIWSNIKDLFEQNIIIAHNAASFDISVLRCLLSNYKIEIPAMKYACTMEAAKTLGWNPKLKDLCEIHGIKLLHHDALSDAEACAQIAQVIHNEFGFHTSFKVKSVNQEPVRKQSQARTPTFNHSQYDIMLINLQREHRYESFDESYFQGKKVVVSGVFVKYPERSELLKILQEKGCQVMTGVSGKIDLFIIGSSAGPRKLKDVLELNENGKNIHIINENSLYQLL